MRTNSIAKWFNITATQQRRYYEEDGASGYVLKGAGRDGWETVGEVEGRLSKGMPRNQMFGGKLAAEQTRKFYCLCENDIKRGDRLVVINKEGEDPYETILSVIDVANPSMANHHLEVECKEHRPGIPGEGSGESTGDV